LSPSTMIILSSKLKQSAKDPKQWQ